MSKIGFWESVFDDRISWREASAINEAHDAIEAMTAASASNDQFQAQQLQKLFALDRAQARHIERLSVTVDVLTELLLEAGVLGDEALTARVSERVKALEEAEAVAEKKGPTIQCSRCFKMVAAKGTQITASGAVCDRCYYA